MVHVFGSLLKYTAQKNSKELVPVAVTSVPDNHLRLEDRDIYMLYDTT